SGDTWKIARSDPDRGVGKLHRHHARTARCHSVWERKHREYARRARAPAGWIDGLPDARQTGECHGEFALVVRRVAELAGEVVGVGLHVEMAVPAQVEEDRTRLALFTAAHGLVNRFLHGVVGFGCRHD